MRIQRLVKMINKPLLLSVPENTTADEIKLLWDTGVDGIVMEADAMKPDKVKELRKAINDLSPRSAKKRGKSEALLPRYGGYQGEERSEPPDGDDEEDW